MQKAKRITTESTKLKFDLVKRLKANGKKIRVFLCASGQSQNNLRIIQDYLCIFCSVQLKMRICSMIKWGDACGPQSDDLHKGQGCKH